MKRKNSAPQPRLHTFADVFATVSYAAVLGGICAAAGFLISFPFLLPAAALYALVLNRKRKREWEEIAKNLETVDESWAARFPEAGWALEKLRAYSKMMGIQKTPALHIPTREVLDRFEKAPSGMEKADRFRKAAQWAACRLAYQLQAFSYGTAKTGILLSPRFLEEMTPPQTDGVLAHEAAHVASGYGRKEELLFVLKKTARLTVAWGAVLHAVPVLGLPGLREGLAFLFAHAATDGFSYAAACLCTRLAGDSMLRQQEFQADRISAETTGDPQAFKSCLQKIGEDYPVQEGLNGTGPRPAPLVFRIAEAAFSRSPSLERRCARLEKIAQKRIALSFNACG